MPPLTRDIQPGPSPRSTPLLLAILLLLSFTAPSIAQDIPVLDAPPSPKARQPAAKPQPKTTDDVDDEDDKQKTQIRAAEYARDSIAAFRRGDFVKAEQLLLEQLKLQPKNFVVYYNLACCRLQSSDAEGGLDYLTKAIENGFCDLRQLRNDPSFNLLREHEGFKRIVTNWDAVLEARRDANLKGSEEVFKKGYVNSTDQRLRLAYRSAFDENAFTAAKTELRKLAEWGAENIIEGLLDESKMREDAWVVVILPNRLDYMRWVVSLYGPAAASGNSMIAGSYEHDAKRLVAMDLGSTLRHEFFHVLHWRDMTRRGQSHPIWIMEGICSLVEDYDTDETGKLVPSTSWRTNTVKRLDKLNRLTPIEALATLPPQRFSGDRPLANYAQARTFFLYLYQKGKLKTWYSTYVEGYREDPSGVKAIELVLGKTIKDVNKDYRAWLKALPEVPEQIGKGMASLGLEIDSGSGEGPVVASVDRRPNRPDLKIGDVITTIDNRPTRDNAELVRVLSTYKPGDTVEVGYRRGKIYGTTTITLIAR